MADLTVLIAPQPLPRTTTFSRFTRRAPSPVSRPIMVTLELAADEPSTGTSSLPSSPTQKTSALPELDNGLLSPPRNTFKARPRPRLPRPHTHSEPAETPVRPASAPPTETLFRRVPEFTPQTELEIYRNVKRRTGSLSTFAAGSNTRGGELLRPPPPLFRPTTFWRRTRRSGVTGASYSPSSHLVRRSTFLAAGLALDTPRADLSAFCVESRVGFTVVKPEVIPLTSTTLVLELTRMQTMPTRKRISLSLAFVALALLVSAAAAHPAQPAQTIAHHNVNYAYVARQAPAPAPQPAPSLNQQPPQPQPQPQRSSISVPAPSSSSTPSTFTSTSASASASSSVSASASTSASASAFGSANTTSTRIAIPALPPGPSLAPNAPPSLRKQKPIMLPAVMTRGMSGYLVAHPAILGATSGGLGVLQGALAVWCCCRKRWKKGRAGASGKKAKAGTRKAGWGESLTLGGGAYLEAAADEEPIWENTEEDEKGGERETGTEGGADYGYGYAYRHNGGGFAAPRSNSNAAGIGAGGRGVGKSGMWLDRALSRSRSREKLNGVRGGGGAMWPGPLPALFDAAGEDEAGSQGDAARPAYMRTTTAGTQMSLYSQPSAASRVDHGALRRGILAKIQGDARGGAYAALGGREAAESVTVSRVSTREGVSRASTAMTASTGTTTSRRPGHARKESDLCVRDVRLPAHDEDARTWVAGSGFRMVEEEGDEDGEGKGGGSVILSAAAIRASISAGLASLSPAKSSAGGDAYTALPVRKTPTKRWDGPRSGESTPTAMRTRMRNSTPSTPARTRSPISPRRTPTRDRLPLSPPLITSPPLEGQLCFTGPSARAVPLSLAAYDLGEPLPMPFAPSPGSGSGSGLVYLDSSQSGESEQAYAACDVVKA
ncbi:hypothetical protein HWV62_12727 [Athelia sp. TMB]|nr:hypothetical protein HWV62_12727 [Athelia sp. TMB]